MGYEVKTLVNTKYWRWFTIWLNPSFGVILNYRLDRFFYLVFGNAWTIIRIFFPLHLIFRVIYCSSEIHFRANIGKGLRILHPTLGVVVNGKAIIGRNLILTGGNCIGFRGASDVGKLVIGDNVNLGANAVILGPVMVGDNVKIGAGAVVISDVESDQTVVGVPAESL